MHSNYGTISHCFQMTGYWAKLVNFLYPCWN